MFFKYHSEILNIADRHAAGKQIIYVSVHGRKYTNWKKNISLAGFVCGGGVAEKKEWATGWEDSSIKCVTTRGAVFFLGLYKLAFLSVSYRRGAS